MSESEREMTLEEWVHQLPSCHLAQKEYQQLLAEIKRLEGEVDIWKEREEFQRHYATTREEADDE